ncbi:MAG: hypothetical protein FJY74_00625 [Candidatus Eisenbacteria bacterium]|nr:hypothetical protein [Candidatus Eisenbacteria bacterium]
MKRIATVLAALGASLAWALPASSFDAGDVTVRGSVDGEYLHNVDLDGSVFDGRVEFGIEVGRFLLGATYRAYQLSDPGYSPAQKDIPRSEVRHRYAEFRNESLSARAGSFFCTFGKGLALRSYEQTDLEHDTALDGVLIGYGTGPLAFTAVSGVVSEPLSRVRTREHTVRGLEAAAAPWDWVRLSARAVERSWEDADANLVLPPAQARREDVVLDGAVDLWLGRVALSGEYARRDVENPVTGAEAGEGRALYLSGTFDLGLLTLFGEFKDYDLFSHHLINPPTCVREHPWTLMNRATYEISLDDERGFLGEGTLPVGDALSLTAGASEARTHSGNLSHWEIFGELSHSLAASVSGAVAGSWSREYLLGKFTEHLIGAAEFDVELPAEQRAELGIEIGSTDDVTGSAYTDYMGSLTWYARADLTVSAVFERSTADFEEREAWFSAELKKRLSDDVEVLFGAGTQRGGKKCAGGVCWFEPEFEGVRVRLSAYF